MFFGAIMTLACECLILRFFLLSRGLRSFTEGRQKKIDEKRDTEYSLYTVQASANKVRRQESEESREAKSSVMNGYIVCQDVSPDIHRHGSSKIKPAIGAVGGFHNELERKFIRNL